MRNALFGCLIIVATIGLFMTPALSQQNPRDCSGEGCCCNAQAGGNWDDCTDPATSCRRQTGAPYLQICTNRTTSPAAIAPLRPTQPANCRLSDDTPAAVPGTSASGCRGAGCCCNIQLGGNWPDCLDSEFECRMQTASPFLQVCVRKGSPFDTPLHLASSEPANCRKPNDDAGRGREGSGEQVGKPLGPDDIIDAGGTGELFDKEVRIANLKDCGNGDPKTVASYEHLPHGMGLHTWLYMGVSTPCPGLTGGKVVDFHKVCNEFPNTGSWRPPMTVRLLPWGVPICWSADRARSKSWPPNIGAGEVEAGLNGNGLDYVCQEAYQRRIKIPGKQIETNVRSIVKYSVKNLQVECFYMKLENWLALVRANE